VHLPCALRPCSPCRPLGGWRAPTKEKTYAYFFFVGVLRSRHRPRRRLCCKVPVHLLMWGRLTLSCRCTNYRRECTVLFSSTSQDGFSRSLTMAERREKPGPAAGLALSRMTVRPPLASSPCLPWTLSVQHVLALSSEELSYAFVFTVFLLWFVANIC